VTDTDPNTGKTRRSQLGLIAAAALIALVVVTGIVVLVTGHRGGGQASEGSPAAPPSTTTSPVAPGAAGGFGVPTTDVFGRRVDLPVDPAGQPLPQSGTQHRPSDPDWLTAAPAGLSDKGGWQRVHGAVVPFSTSDGPTRIVNGAAAGYAHTPQGAALAAAYTLNEIGARPGDSALLDVRAVLTPEDRAQFQAGVAAGRMPMQQPESITRYLIAPDAFKVDQYADDFCIVRLATRAGGTDASDGPSWTTGPLPMVWVDGDWKLRFAGGQVATETIHDLVGWTQWAG
jgi:hypothetical protein